MTKKLKAVEESKTVEPSSRNWMIGVIVAVIVVAGILWATDMVPWVGETTPPATTTSP